jgi:hypothetical protein
MVLGYESTITVYLGLLLVSVLRPTLFPIVLALIFISHHRQITLTKFKALLKNHNFIISSIFLIHGLIAVNKAVDLAFGIRAGNPQANISFKYRLSEIFDNLSNLDFIASGLLILFFVICFIQRVYVFIGILIISILIFAVTAPAENLKVPIYKSEILLPFIFLACLKVMLLVRFIFSQLKKSVSFVAVVWGTVVGVTVVLNISYLSNYNLSGSSWSERFVVDRSNIDEIYFTHGKVDYDDVIEKLKNDFIGCKFLDITYDGAFLLNSNIETYYFLRESKHLNISIENLTTSNLGQCVILGNYSLNRLIDHASERGFEVDLLARYTSDVLGTTVFVFRTKPLG